MLGSTRSQLICIYSNMICMQLFYFLSNRLLDSLVVQYWLRVREVSGSIPSQGPRHTKDVIKMVPVVSLFSTEYSKGKLLALSQELRQENKCNGYKLGQKIFQSRTSLAVVAGMKNRMTTQNRQKSNAIKKEKKKEKRKQNQIYRLYGYSSSYHVLFRFRILIF